MARTPAFRHMGGKARLRKWLVDHFPDGDGGTYLEPFAGKGNVFFEAVQRLNYSRWILADCDTRFLNALIDADLSALPATVERQDFEYWQSSRGTITTLIEPRITYAGKGYRYGFSGSSGTHVGYNGPIYRKVCESARELLRRATIREMSWERSVDEFQPSFVYLDPPYFGTEASYDNIDHAALVERLNSAKFDWALSGYHNALYDARLDFKCRFERERNSEIKSSNNHGFSGVTEVLWTNYEL